ncbi:MAG: pyridoxal phosphate-dependent aminotransferase [Deltaproteobacteria bacterium]|jgi:aspartate aminotransferase|nr:pyridoxal phosphate-dependent aminotransferase [Deltaproteobacteria bacterium]
MAISKKMEERMKNSSWIRKMFEIGNDYRKKYGSEAVFDFTLGNPTIEPPVAFKKELMAVAAKTDKGVHRYMSNNGLFSTRKAAAAALNKHLKQEISPDNLVMTTGAAGALNIVLNSILDSGNEVIIISPFFPEYKFYIENNGGKTIVVESKDDFSLDLKAIAAVLNGSTKAIILNSPNNPAGVIYSETSLKLLQELLEKHSDRGYSEVFVISDEPYRKLVYDNIKLPQNLDIFKNSIMCYSHSKDLGIPGERIGYAAVAPSIDDGSQLLAALNFANRTLGFVNASAFMQRVIENLQEVSVEVSGYQQKRDLFYDNLVSYGYEITKPSGAFYLLVKSPLRVYYHFCQLLLEEKILAVPGRGFGRKGYFRLSYCLEQKTIERSLQGFKNCIEKL